MRQTERAAVRVKTDRVEMLAGGRELPMWHLAPASMYFTAPLFVNKTSFADVERS